MWYEQGDEVCDPDELTNSDWKHVLTIPRETERKSYFNYRLTEITNKLNERENESSQHHQEGSDQHTSQSYMFDFITEEAMNKWKNKR